MERWETETRGPKTDRQDRMDAKGSYLTVQG